jgi:low affinity Fe/Cu permease
MADPSPPTREDGPRKQADDATNGSAAGESRLIRQVQLRGLTPMKLPVPIDPALAKHVEERASNAQNRISDAITRFAGSMAFVYLHIIWFSCWIGFGVEKYPYGLLTMIVSLEAIFLSTFVMISQNRSEAKRQVIADEQWSMVQEEDRQNEQLLGISRQILELTQAVHSYAADAAGHRAAPRGRGTGGSGGGSPPAAGG